MSIQLAKAVFTAVLGCTDLASEAIPTFFTALAMVGGSACWSSGVEAACKGSQV